MKEKLAGLISKIFNPFVVGGAVLIVISCRDAGSPAEALKWVTISLLLSIIPGLAIVLFLVRLKRLDGLFISQRWQRTRLYLVEDCLAVIGWVILRLLESPVILQATFTAGLVLLVMFTVINLFWKISLHTSFVAGAAAIFTVVYGLAGILMVIPLALVAWARLEEGFHTTAQVVTGAVLTAGTVMAVFWLYGLIP